MKQNQRLKNPIRVVALILIMSITVMVGGCSYQNTSSTDADMGFGQYNSDYPLAAIGSDCYYYLSQISDSGYILIGCDKKTLESAAVCSKGDCSHDSEGCNAYFSEPVYLGIYDDELYAVSGSTLYLMNTDGSGSEKLYGLDFLEGLSDVQILIHRGYLIACGIREISDSHDAEMYIVSFETGECEQGLVYTDSEFVRICVYSDELYILSGSLDLTTATGYDLTSGEITDLFTTDEVSILNPLFKVTANEAYISEGGTVYKFDPTDSSFTASISFDKGYEVLGITDYYVFAGCDSNGGYKIFIKDCYGNDKLSTELGYAEGVVSAVNTVFGADNQYIYIKTDEVMDDGSEVSFAAALDYFSGDYRILWRYDNR